MRVLVCVGNTGWPLGVYVCIYVYCVCVYVCFHFIIPRSVVFHEKVKSYNNSDKKTVIVEYDTLY